MFPLRRWFYHQPLWYYHMPARVHRLAPDRRFYARLDAPLQELCRVVLAAGLLTTPSCAGHFYPRGRFARIWDRLRVERDRIRTIGLLVRDSESHEPRIFAERDYELPWPDFAVFYAAAGGQQSRGFLGIVAPNERRAVVRRIAADGFATAAVRVAFDAQLSEALGQATLGIDVVSRCPAERDAAWADVTEYLRGRLNA